MAANRRQPRQFDPCPRKDRSVKKLIFAAVAALFTSSLAFADTQTGIDAFSAQKFDVALKELQPAAEAGDANAMYYLGQMYAGGFGVDKDPKKALELYRTAAELGHTDSQRELGTALALGEGVQQDVTQGLKWLMIAARSGNEQARAYAERFGRFMSRTVVLSARMEAAAWQREFAKNNPGAEMPAPMPMESPKKHHKQRKADSPR